jgi:hypothetical protein
MYVLPLATSCPQYESMQRGYITIVERVLGNLPPQSQCSLSPLDDSTIPEVDFDIGPSWSGLLPISNKVGETRKVHILRNMTSIGLIPFTVSSPPGLPLWVPHIRLIAS